MRQVPDLIVILLDSSVTGEEAAVGHVENGLLCPELLVTVLTVSLLMNSAVCTEVTYHHELVSHAVITEYK